MEEPDKIEPGYLVDVESGERLEFQYNPDSIRDSKGTLYASVQVPGMSHPRLQYVAGEGRRIAFQIHLFKGPVRERAEWLRSLLYPDHSNAGSGGPHRVLLVFGSLYPGLLCVVRKVQVHYFQLFAPQSLEPQRAEVDLELEEWVEQSISLGELRP